MGCVCARSAGIPRADPKGASTLVHPCKKKPNLSEPSGKDSNPYVLGTEVPRNKNGCWVGARLYCKTENSKPFCPTEAHNLTQHLLLVCAQLWEPRSTCVSCGTLPLCLCVLLCPVAFQMVPISQECCDDWGGVLSNPHSQPQASTGSLGSLCFYAQPCPSEGISACCSFLLRLVGTL